LAGLRERAHIGRDSRLPAGYTKQLEEAEVPSVPAPNSRQASSKSTAANLLVRQRKDGGGKLHGLQNTLASLRLRIGVMAADPTCRWAQEENIAAIQRIIDEALQQCEQLREANHQQPLARKRRRRT
jgi:hypothetical protein